MDYRKEHNRWPALHKRWRFLVMVLVAAFSALLPLHVFSRLRLLVIPGGVDMSGNFPRENGSVYWSVLSKPETNQLQFVLLLPVTTTFDWSDSANWPVDGNDYCLVQVKSNRHQWKLENFVDPKTGVQIVQLRDVTANTTNVLSLDKGRFWQLDDAGRATRLETADAATLARIMREVETNQANFQTP